VRLWVERSVGLPLRPGKTRDFAQFRAHGFLDCTDHPSPTIDARPRACLVIEDDGRTAPGRRIYKDKPPYVVPSMNEINALPLNGLRVASLFSGCGGSSLGYRLAGFKVVYANEFVPAAQETYRANFPETYIDGRDIRTVTGEDIRKVIGKAELDILDGSPPCASFSMAGSRAQHWGKVKSYSDTKQRTDDLFFQYARLVSELRPRVFVAENVSGLVKGVGKGYFLDILAAFKELGYRVEARLLDAQWLGVPQVRLRLIFVGVRSDLATGPAFPTPLRYRYTLRDAIPWIDSAAKLSTFGGQRSANEPVPTVMTHGRQRTRNELAIVEPETDMARYSVGRELNKLGQGQQSKRYFQLTRAALAEPCPTVTVEGKKAHAASVAHPLECRKFSIAELRRICSFPEDFVLTGSYAQQWERLGRAVPPAMMAAIATTLRDKVLTQKGADCSAPLRRRKAA